MVMWAMPSAAAVTITVPPLTDADATPLMSDSAV